MLDNPDPGVPLKDAILKILRHEDLTAKAIARKLNNEAHVRSALAYMVFKEKSVCCKRVLGLDVYYVGTAPQSFWEVKDHTGHKGAA